MEVRRRVKPRRNAGFFMLTLLVAIIVYKPILHSFYFKQYYYLNTLFFLCYFFASPPKMLRSSGQATSNQKRSPELIIRPNNWSDGPPSSGGSLDLAKCYCGEELLYLDNMGKCLTKLTIHLLINNTLLFLLFCF